MNRGISSFRCFARKTFSSPRKNGMFLRAPLPWGRARERVVCTKKEKHANRLICTKLATFAEIYDFVQNVWFSTTQSDLTATLNSRFCCCFIKCRCCNPSPLIPLPQGARGFFQYHYLLSKT